MSYPYNEHEGVLNITVESTAKGEITLSRVPRFWLRHILVCANLHNRISRREYKLECYTAKKSMSSSENYQYTELALRSTEFLEQLIDGDQAKIERARNDMSKESFDAWVQDQERSFEVERQLQASSVEPSTLPLPSLEPKRTLANIRLLGIRLIDVFAHYQNGIKGMLNDNPHNTPEDALRRIRSIIQMAKEMEAGLELVQRLQKDQKTENGQRVRSALEDAINSL